MHIWHSKWQVSRLYGQRKRHRGQPRKNKSCLGNEVTIINEGSAIVGKITALSRFILRLANRNLPFFETLQAMKQFEWTTECERTFFDLKAYLSSPPLLLKPIDREPLYLYLAVSENAISSVLICKEAKVPKPVYYVNKMLQGVEKRYLEIEKLALALVVSARKLRPYFQSHEILILTNQPLRQVLSKPKVSCIMVK